MSFVLLLLVLAVGYGWIRSTRKPKLHPYLLEHFLKITDPVPLCGKADVIWITKQGILIIGDYKSRNFHQAYESEVIQLSVYRLLLEKSQPKPVADYGYIHFKGKTVKVKLLSEQAVIALYRRYWNVIDGKVNPCKAAGKRYCQYCSHLSEC